ncbi:MAG: Postacrosomal sheath domain-binding protein [Acidimicrobiales bacterium]|jgi:uncharacterized RDD family membrane protein YckC|nr:Postacrosomal sheath domain-binding protein [Acidimicrobiales bacterium]
MSTPPPPPGYNPPPPGYGAQQPGYGAPPPAYQAPPPGYQAPPPGYQPYQQAPQRQYAGIGARIGARLLDGLIGIIFAVPAVIAFFAVPKHYQDCTVNGEASVCKVPTGAGWGIIAALGVIGALTYFVIYVKKVGNSQSWGQKACGTRVVDKDSGAQIGTGRSVGRFFAQYLSGAVCYLGYLWALWDKDKQTWHDKIVGSVVVKA